LKAIKLIAIKIDKERVTVVDHGMNERRSDGLSSGIFESVPDSDPDSGLGCRLTYNIGQIHALKVNF